MRGSLPAISLATAAAAIVVATALWLFPGAPCLSVFTAFGLIWGSTLLVLSRQSWASRPLALTMLAAITLIVTGVVVNVWGFTTLAGTDIYSPVLENVDQHRYYSSALSSAGLDGGEQTRGHHMGYGLLVAAMWSVTGASLVSPLMLNVAMTAATLLLTASVAAKVCDSQPRRSAAIAAGCLAAVCYFLNSATLMLKEAPTATAMALFAFSFVSAGRRKWFSFAAATLLLSIIRCEWLLMAIAGVIITSRWRDKSSRVSACVMLAILAASLYFSNLLFDSGASVTLTAESNSYMRGEGPRAVLWSLLGDYFSFPLWKKILMLPLSAAIQFLTPFPWNFMRDISFGITQFYSHISYPWYAFGAIAIFWLFALSRKSPATLTRLTLWGIALWLIPCFMFAGTVSRYTLPMLPLLAPAVAYTLETKLFTKSFIVYSACFAALTTVTLIVLHSRLCL